MARNKYPEETVERILDVATELFLRQGYEQTTIQDIVDNLGGLTKGAVYHHFKSKEEILDAVTTRLYRESDLFGKVQRRQDLNGLQKLQGVLQSSINEPVDSARMKLSLQMATYFKNPWFLAQNVLDCFLVAKEGLKMIEEGNADGSLHVEKPKQAAEVLMLLVNFWLTYDIASVSQEEFLDKLDFTVDLLDKMGLPVISGETYDKCIELQKQLLANAKAEQK